MQYKFITRSNVVIAILRQDGASIPLDPENPDYREYLRWIADGNTTTPADPEPLPTPADLRRNEAEPYARTIPNGWRTWTQAQWTDYYNANISATQIDTITNLADAKAFLRKLSVVIDRMAKLEIALRDFIFPDLPED